MIARAEAAWAGMAQRSRTRLLGLAVGAPAWVVLVLSRWLVPAEQGFGTHRQLGLPVKFVGVGEKVTDLRPFDPNQFADALFPGSG